MNLAQQGEMGRVGGWLGRARRLVEREGRECVEQGYLLMPLMFQHEASGDLDAAIATAAEAAEIAERFGDADLLVVAVHSQGQLMVSQGRAKEGLALLDDSMLAVTNGVLSSIASGIVYCGVILGCQAAFEVRRAQEWTSALAAWCREQPDMGRLHRALPPTPNRDSRAEWRVGRGAAGNPALSRCTEPACRRAGCSAARTARHDPVWLPDGNRGFVRPPPSGARATGRPTTLSLSARGQRPVGSAARRWRQGPGGRAVVRAAAAGGREARRSAPCRYLTVMIRCIPSRWCSWMKHTSP